MFTLSKLRVKYLLFNETNRNTSCFGSVLIKSINDNGPVK